ncbi:MAG: transcription termination factor NusA [Acidobacteria bacterium]|uniref:Transcription termination/antitermination protein NusA n=1 Tax=Candidatus Polarisedimenticola svalbardensis TaxID=2886004 RepID=A0A8J7CC75_9BACT|nr:transcription termination factor NusA [Candidatus Polarisedimenticola svalbardensis]
MSSELYHTIEAIGREKGIDAEVVIQAIEEAYAAASRKYYRSKEDYGARFDKQSGKFALFQKHVVVEEEEMMDPLTEITLEEAQEKHPEIELGEVIETPIADAEAPQTRIAIQAAKQVIFQKVKEAERELVWVEYHERVGELLTGQVKRFDRGDMIVDLGRTEAVISRREQSRAEHYNPGDRIRAILINVERQGKGPQLLLSRADELLVAKLFEMEVPEIYDGTVIIRNVARDAGERSKVAVDSTDRDVDPVGACVGMKGSRVQAVIRELRGEKIDIVQYSDEQELYVRNALNPAMINRVSILDYDTRELEVIVGEDQLSLAIGKRGQNVRLASKLVEWHIDIKSEAEKKAEVEDEMEQMAYAVEQIRSLPEIEEEVANRLLDAGFLAVEEVALASLEDLMAIDGINEDQAIDIHDAAETRLEELIAEEEARLEAEEAAAAEAEAAGETADTDEPAPLDGEAVEGDEVPDPQDEVATEAADSESTDDGEKESEG